MATSISFGWLLVGVFLLLVVWAVSAYNRLVALRQRIANAFGQIDVELKRRHDLVPNLVDVARGYLRHEQETLHAVTRARASAIDAVQAARAQPASAAAIATLASAEQALMGQIGRLMAVAEAYPELKADRTLRELSETLTSTENRIGFARQAYNDAVLDLNTTAESFPELIVARLGGFAPAAVLQSTASEIERAAPRVAL